MKKSYYLCFLFAFILMFSVNSCKKETTSSSNLQQVKNYSEDFSWLSSKQKVSSQEITTWIRQKLPNGYAADIQLNKAQQNVINNHHVIRIPIANDAALFFTKANDSLKVYAYKWLDQKPGEKLFTGKLFTYSFQDQFITAQVYSKGQLIKEGSLNQEQLSMLNNPSVGVNNITTAAVPTEKVKVLDFGNGVASVWCFLTGGTWTGFQTNTCYYGPGSIGYKVMSFVASIFSSDDGGGGGGGGAGGSGDGGSSGSVAGVYSGGVSNGNGGYNFYANYNSFGGYGLNNNGAGTAWISYFVPPDANACTPGSGGEQEATTTITQSSDCNGHWESYTVDVNPISLETSPEEMNLDGDDPDAAWWTDNSMDYLQKQALPPYSQMYGNYPKTSTGGEMYALDVAHLVGGEVEQLFIVNGYANACALRVSIALNKSGITIPFIQDHTFQGADGKYYFLSAAKLFHFLKKTFPPPAIDMNSSQGGQFGINYQAAFANHQGLLLMVPNNTSKIGGYNATGHASMFNGSVCVGGISHTPFNVPGGVKEIVLWEMQ